jgi:hypothetical protein
MANYEVPKEIDDKSAKELLKQARTFLNKKQNETAITIFGTMLSLFIVLITVSLSIRPYLAPTNLLIALIAIFIFSISFAIAIPTLVIPTVAMFVRRALTFFWKYPTTEEYIFARCNLIVCRIYEKNLYDKKWWSSYFNTKHGATYQVSWFCDELSSFCKDRLNVRRKLYESEFRRLLNGGDELQKMIVFSSKETQNLFLKFSFAFVNGNDEEAHNQLKKIIQEAEKYGKLENRFQKISDQLTGWEGLITALISLIGSIIALILVFFK